jgi:hypothetical protein
MPTNKASRPAAPGNFLGEAPKLLFIKATYLPKAVNLFLGYHKMESPKKNTIRAYNSLWSKFRGLMDSHPLRRRGH